MIKLVAFDLVGTLIRGEVFSDARNSLQLNFNERWEKAEKAANFLTYFDYEAVFEALLGQATGVIYQNFRDYLLTHVTGYLYPEVQQVLQELIDQGIKLGFVTDGSNEVEGEMIRHLLKNCDIEPDNCIIVTGQEVGGGKAGGKPFHELILRATRLDINLTDIVFVGDKPAADIDGAKQMGLITVLIYRLNFPFLGRYKPDYEITKLIDLPHLINRA